MPAAAVIRRVQALFGFTGYKGCAVPDKSGVKYVGLTGKLPLKLPGLSPGEVSGIPGVAVKCVNIRRNTNGEGS